MGQQKEQWIDTLQKNNGLTSKALYLLNRLSFDLAIADVIDGCPIPVYTNGWKDLKKELETNRKLTMRKTGIMSLEQLAVLSSQDNFKSKVTAPSGLSAEQFWEDSKRDIFQAREFLNEATAEVA